MSNFLRARRTALIISVLAILAASCIHAQTDCSGQVQSASNGAQSSSLPGAASKVQGAPGGKASPGNGADLPTEQQPKGSSSHNISLSWKASTSRNVVGYNIYRRGNSGSRQKLNSVPILGTSCVDRSIQDGQTYVYVVTAVNSSGKESADSIVATVKVPVTGSVQHDAPPISQVVSGNPPVQ